MERGMTVDQVLRALWRRKLLVLAIAGGVFAVGLAIVAALPSVYKATASVRFEPNQPIADLVQPTVTEPVERRIVTIRQELLARPVLERVIREQNLYPEVMEKEGIDAALERFRSDLEVKLEGDAAFDITYSAKEPELAARVVNRIPEVFAEEAVKNRQRAARRAEQLFNDEVEELKKSVASWEKKIAQFKVDHMGELPEQLEVNMRGLDRVSAEIEHRYEELRAAEMRRGDLLRASYAGDSEAGRLQQQELETQRALVAARAQWTEDHPEVKKLQTELNAIRGKLRDAENRMVEERRERARMNRVIDGLQAEIAQLHQKAEAYQARLDVTPKWAQELAMMQRDYEIARAKYDSVISRKVEAELARELELKSAPDIFRVLSRATVPVTPASPDRMGGTMIALLIALALGILVAILAEARDDSIRDVSEVKERLPLPVLAVVPEMAGKTERRVLMPNYAQRPAGPQTLN
ncbi:MAG: chain-length determining protein [Myxococcaceae bacterium]|nr:chain-length determining protein [Myxococcaceae bacterium]